MKAYVTCHCCQGRGKLELTGVYAETLNGLRRLTKSYGYCVANQHAYLFGCKATALNQRLSKLEEHGLATSEKFGRQRRFKAKG